MKILAQRPNPFDELWGEWSLVICTKCKKIMEWQSHSEEAMHGGELNITALVTKDYLQQIYGLTYEDVDSISKGKVKAKRYNRYTKSFDYEYA